MRERVEFADIGFRSKHERIDARMRQIVRESSQFVARISQRRLPEVCYRNSTVLKRKSQCSQAVQNRAKIARRCVEVLEKLGVVLLIQPNRPQKYLESLEEAQDERLWLLDAGPVARLSNQVRERLLRKCAAVSHPPSYDRLSLLRLGHHP